MRNIPDKETRGQAVQVYQRDHIEILVGVTFLWGLVADDSLHSFWFVGPEDKFSHHKLEINVKVAVGSALGSEGWQVQHPRGVVGNLLHLTNGVYIRMGHYSITLIRSQESML